MTLVAAPHSSAEPIAWLANSPAPLLTVQRSSSPGSRTATPHPTSARLSRPAQGFAAVGSRPTPPGIQVLSSSPTLRRRSSPRPGSRSPTTRSAQQDVAAQTIRDYAGIFFVLLELGQILLYAVVAWLLRRSREHRAPRLRANRLPQVLRAGALFVASAPAASFLANLVPWWRAVHPAPVLGAAVLIGAIVLAALALLGPWRRWHLLGSAAFVAAVTTFVLVADVTIGGSRLQLSSLYGLSTLIAGRFYGFGNVAFAVLAMAAQFTALALAAYALDRGRRRAAIATVGVIATVAVLADGWPSWGADSGGVLAMVPGFALLGLAVAGKQLSVRRLAVLAGAAAAAVVTIAVLDWLRGASNRSHMGRFVQQIIDGDAGPVVERKLDAMVRSFTRGPEGIVIPLLLAL